VTCCDPLACTAPMPSTETSVARKSASSGLPPVRLNCVRAYRDGGGWELAVVEVVVVAAEQLSFLQAPSIKIAHNVSMVASTFMVLLSGVNIFHVDPLQVESPANPKISIEPRRSVLIYDSLLLTSYFQLQFGCELRPVKVN